ncbi:MAG: hypothetical protein D3916_18810 [Candidatus Electrothrix sp. MAN1_4]|nr:hypothetical protein [Candidatus Electrothrix sp. MAN1_4]
MAHCRRIQAVVGQEMTGAKAALLAAVGFGPVQEIRFVVGHRIGHDGVYGKHGIGRPAGRPYGVHPRVCGEHSIPSCPYSVTARFIPACAGNMVRINQSVLVIAVHPRVCGEH